MKNTIRAAFWMMASIAGFFGLVIFVFVCAWGWVFVAPYLMSGTNPLFMVGLVVSELIPVILVFWLYPRWSDYCIDKSLPF